MVVRSCSSCGGETLEPGFMTDRNVGDGGYALWLSGQLEATQHRGAKHRGRNQLAVHAHRCTRCGHLDLFAL